MSYTHNTRKESSSITKSFLNIVLILKIQEFHNEETFENVLVYVFSFINEFLIEVMITWLLSSGLLVIDFIGYH